eukprot:GFYU01006462.1.p1 GENE.GFYU01006462.1~~GFYU01006462.1.p1  ORF type:complete len:214 (-),score=68.13 GFYU01006462.1:126-767(-)
MMSYNGAEDDEFRNVRPRGRNERRQNFNRDVLEKARLGSRREGFHRYDDPGNVVTMDSNPMVPGFMSESDRFHTDTAGEEKRRREQYLQKYDEMIDHKRERALQREEDRWHKLEDEARAEQERADSLKNTLKAKNNENSVPYNPITQRYDDGDDGDKLKRQDEYLRYRADVRAHYLFTKGSGDGFDPITGNPKSQFPNPNAPDWVQRGEPKNF